MTSNPTQHLPLPTAAASSAGLYCAGNFAALDLIDAGCEVLSIKVEAIGAVIELRRPPPEGTVSSQSELYLPDSRGTRRYVRGRYGKYVFVQWREEACAE